MNVRALYTVAEELARSYDGSEASYDAFMGAAIKVDAAGAAAEKVDGLLNMAIEAVQNVNREEDFLSRLERGGAKIFHHGAVFMRPDLSQTFNEAGDDPKAYEGPIHEPRLRETVIALQDKGIFFDDLVIDVGSVHNNQMRKWPYAIVTIPRLNAQYVVADQKNEAMFVANPAIPFMNWALFEKKMAGEEGGPFENVKRIVHADAWEKRFTDALFGNDPRPGPKVHLDGWTKAQRKSKYPLTEEMIVAMAKLYRERHPDKQWPATHSGTIDPLIVREVTGDPHWQKETWKAINAAARVGGRGLEKGSSLPKILESHGCHYNLTEEMIVAMAKLYRERHPDKQWPTAHSGAIDPDIVREVTGDPHWQAETWLAINVAGQKGLRGLEKGRTLARILDDHCPERGKMRPQDADQKPQPPTP